MKGFSGFKKEEILPEEKQSKISEEKKEKKDVTTKELIAYLLKKGFTSTKQGKIDPEKLEYK